MRLKAIVPPSQQLSIYGCIFIGLPILSSAVFPQTAPNFNKQEVPPISLDGSVFKSKSCIWMNLVTVFIFGTIHRQRAKALREEECIMTYGSTMKISALTYINDPRKSVVK